MLLNTLKIKASSSLLFLTLIFILPLPSQADQPTVRVGVIQSLTGIAAEYGKTVVQSLQLATEDLRDRTGTNVELLIEDDQTLSKNTVSAFQNLRSKGVDVIIGPTWDFTTNAVLPIAGKAKIVLFSTSTLLESVQLKEANGYGFVNLMTAQSEAAGFGKYLHQRSIDSATIIYTNNSWGEAQLSAYSKILSENKVSSVEVLQSPSYDPNAWSTVLTKVREKKSDLIVLLLNKEEIDIALHVSRDLKLSTGIFASVNLYDSYHASSTKNLYEGVCFSYPMEQLRREQNFLQAYKSRFGRDARISADSSYDALFLIVQGKKIAKEKNIPLREALQQVEYEGVVGLYKFSEQNSFSLGSGSLVCVEKDALIVK